MTFDPATLTLPPPGPPLPATTIDAGASLAAVSCPASTQCTAVDDSGREVTFDPGAPSSPTMVTIDPGSNIADLACPLATQCTAVDPYGVQVTFDPTLADAGGPSPTPVDAHDLSGAACPSDSVCAAVDEDGHEVAFNPSALAAATPTSVDTHGYLLAVACPLVTQCVAVDLGGRAVTFDPTSLGSPTSASVDPGGGGLFGIACPSSTVCVGVDDGGSEVAFDPGAPGTPVPVSIDASGGLSAVACPSSTECVAVDISGNEVTFDPTATGTATPTALDPTGGGLLAVACPTATRCTAVDDAGRELTFDPAAPLASATTATIDHNGGLDAISCPLASECVAVDANGSAFEGDPTATAAWTVEPLTGAGPLAAVACPTASHCVALDTSGDGFSGYLPPANITAPTISGNTKQGQTLTESHGTWTNSPTSFAYQWQDCDSSGNNCTAISGATSQTYTLAASDVGHTIRVQETASNTGGPSSPASSAATGVVQAAPTPPSNTSPPVVSGSTVVSETLSASTGTWYGSVPIAYAYQWQRCGSSRCVNISGATASTYVLIGSDLGMKIRVVVRASNSAGSAPAASSEVGPVLASVAQIKALLTKEITPRGKAAKIGAILKAGGYLLSFKALEPGKALIRWYLVPTGAHLDKAKPVLVAVGSATFSAPATKKIKIKLAAAGRKLLVYASHVKVTARGAFTATGQSSVVALKTFTLRR